MTISLDFLTIQVILTFILSFTRIAALMSTAPLVSNQGIPVIIRVGLASAVVFTLYDKIISSSVNIIATDYVHLTLGIFHELVIGAFLGILLNLIFDALVTFAHLAGIQSGESNESIFNPAISAPTNPIATFTTNMCLMFFLFQDGLYQMLFLLRKSFEIIPLASYSFNLSVFVANYVHVLSAIFIIGLKMVLPLIALMIVIDIFIALSAKIMPQANMFFLFMPTKVILATMLLGVMIIGLSLRVESFFETEFWALLDQLVLGTP